MVVFFYDKTLIGLLTCVFDAYMHKAFPEHLLVTGEPLPLFCDELYTVVSDKAKAERVWNALERKLSASALHEISVCWLADRVELTDELIFRYICKNINSERSQETNFADSDVLALSKLYKQVDYEALRLKQFARFQKTADGIYFAPFEPMHNVLPLAVEHFRDRFSDQKWLIYDVKRDYGYYYDMHDVTEMSLKSDEVNIQNGFLDESILAEDEVLFQKMWKTYFKAICIKERMNPRKHRQDMPVRYWKFLIEKRK